MIVQTEIWLSVVISRPSIIISIFDLQCHHHESMLSPMRYPQSFFQVFFNLVFVYSTYSTLHRHIFWTFSHGNNLEGPRGALRKSRKALFTLNACLYRCGLAASRNYIFLFHEPSSRCFPIETFHSLHRWKQWTVQKKYLLYPTTFGVVLR